MCYIVQRWWLMCGSYEAFIKRCDDCPRRMIDGDYSTYQGSKRCRNWDPEATPARDSVWAPYYCSSRACRKCREYGLQNNTQKQWWVKDGKLIDDYVVRDFLNGLSSEEEQILERLRR